MQLAYKNNAVVPASEMAIVTTFTKLIFGEDAYTTRDLSIIDGFRAVESDVLHDSHEDMGEYLRNLGVREMIQLVSRLHRHLVETAGIDISIPSAAATDSLGIDRDASPR